MYKGLGKYRLNVSINPPLPGVDIRFSEQVSNIIQSTISPYQTSNDEFNTLSTNILDFYLPQIEFAKPGKSIKFTDIFNVIEDKNNQIEDNYEYKTSRMISEAYEPLEIVERSYTFQESPWKKSTDQTFDNDFNTTDITTEEIEKVIAYYGTAGVKLFEPKAIGVNFEGNINSPNLLQSGGGIQWGTENFTLPSDIPNTSFFFIEFDIDTYGSNITLNINSEILFKDLYGKLIIVECGMTGPSPSFTPIPLTGIKVTNIFVGYKDINTNKEFKNKLSEVVYSNEALFQLQIPFVGYS